MQTIPIANKEWVLLTNALINKLRNERGEDRLADKLIGVVADDIMRKRFHIAN